MAEVLIIDDEVDIALLLQTVIKASGMHADCVRTLAQATEMLLRNTYSLVLLDNHLPDGLGINFIKTIKFQLPAAQIIMISAYDSPDDRKAAHKEGVDAFLGKPFSLEALLVIIRN